MNIQGSSGVSRLLDLGASRVQKMLSRGYASIKLILVLYVFWIYRGGQSEVSDHIEGDAERAGATSARKY